MWEVLDKNGVLFSDEGKRGVFPKGSKISQTDVDNNLFTLGGLETLIKNERVKSLKAESNKKMPKINNKGVK